MTTSGPGTYRTVAAAAQAAAVAYRAAATRALVDLADEAVGAPEVVAGHEGLGRPVRWVHTTELPDIAELLREGDLVLTTGIALPSAEAGLVEFATSLVESGEFGLPGAGVGLARGGC